MASLELHADFDRDGRVTGSPAERAARSAWPGAIVVPNMDRDRHSLPGTVSDSRPSQSDYTLASTISGDDELVRLEIRAAAGALGPNDTLAIRCSGVMHTRVKLSDTSGRIIPHRLRAPQYYTLPAMPADGVLALVLQVRTISGARFGRISKTQLSLPNHTNVDHRFTLDLIKVDGAGQEHVEDSGRFSVAPFVLLDRAAPARRIYMVDHPAHKPSTTDMRRVARATRVPLVFIDSDLSDGDTWVQDQYQHAMMQGPNGWRELILHLPRMRHENTNTPITDNLEDVVNTHFRSRDIGLFRDLWDRVVPTRTADGRVARPSFRDLDTWEKSTQRVWSAYDTINRYALDADRNFNVTLYDDWVTLLENFDAELRRARQAISGARADAYGQREQQLADAETACVELVRNIKRQFTVRQPNTPNMTVESEIAGQRAALSGSQIGELQTKLAQMHASENYGGNIESTPAVAGAPLGKIIISNVTGQDDREVMDPDLLQVFIKQRKQAIVEVDATWLKVGHVDEMIAVAPSSRASGGFAILHASARAAIELVRRAHRAYLDGLPSQHHDRVREGRPPSGVIGRLTTDGTSPVTRLLRGKAWLQSSEAGIEPPSIYLELCRAFGSDAGQSGFNVHRIGFIPGTGVERRYPADISVAELSWAETDNSGRSSNDNFESTVLRASRNLLANEFSGVSILPLPVLFDRVHDNDEFTSDHSYWPNRTTAFTPDVVNMQVVKDFLIVPTPYGPRMKIVDAIAVVKGAMEAVEIPAGVRARVGRRLIAAHRMTTAHYWVEKVDAAILYGSIGTIRASYGGMRTDDDVIAAFRDSFPGASDAELRLRIIHPNRRNFTGSGLLREEHSRFRITDGLVDIFELYVAAVAAELGLRLRFVDSWPFHLYEGEIHCGSNVLRSPPAPAAGRPNVWDAPDQAFRSVRFEDEVIEAGSRS